MRSIFSLVLAVAISFLSVPALAQKKVALVIGNAAYKEAPLKNPVNDARAMAVKLRQVGFQVIARENAGKNQMETALAEFGEQLNGGAVGLFFYAGHGMQVNGRNFLLPVDATIASEQRVRLETIDVDLVLDQMEAAKSSVNLVVLDACRNNPFERRFRSSGNGLAQVNAPQGTLIAYATAPGKVASDGDGLNGLYTSRLLQHLATPGLPVEEVFKRVRIDVAKATNSLQTPWESSSLTGSFFFVSPAAAGSSPAAPAPAVDREALFWQSVADSNDTAVLQSYLSQYPKGTFAPAARAKIAALEQRRKDDEAQTARTQQLAAAPAPTAAVTPEQVLWDAVKDSNNPAMLQGYLDRYPNGVYAQAAAVKMAALRPTAATPAPQPVAAPVPSTPTPTRPAAGTRDGRWSGSDSGWTVELTVTGDVIAGTARSTHRSGVWTVTGKIDTSGIVSGLVTMSQARFEPALGGQFPELHITGAGVNGARILLRQESASAAATLDGRWTGTGSAWKMDVTVNGDRISGTARANHRAGEFSVSGRLDLTTKMVDGLITHSGIFLPVRLFGRFPSIDVSAGTAGSDTVVMQPRP
jgi:uncharacterized caspase-like protein